MCIADSAFIGHFLPDFTLAQRAFCDSEIFLRAAALMRLLFGGEVRSLAQRAFCAIEMRLRAAALIRLTLLGHPLTLETSNLPSSFPSTERAASTCLNWLIKLVRSERSSTTILSNPVRFGMQKILPEWLLGRDVCTCTAASD
jgi:hypothetical protein